MSNGVRSEGSPHEQRLGSVVDQVVQPYRHAVFAHHGRRSLHEPPAFRDQIAHQRRCGRADGGGPAAATVYVIGQDKQPVVQRIPSFGMGAGLAHRLGRGQLTETPFQTVDRLQESDGVHCQDSHDVPFAAPHAMCRTVRLIGAYSTLWHTAIRAATDLRKSVDMWMQLYLSTTRRGHQQDCRPVTGRPQIRIRSGTAPIRRHSRRHRNSRAP